MSATSCRALLRVCACAALVCAGARGATAQTLADSVRVRLHDRLASQPVELQRFYERRAVQPAWIGDAGPLARVVELLGILEDAEREGLPPADYIVPPLRPSLDPDSLADFDLALTRAALAYASDLAAGRVDPAVVDTQWSPAARRIEVARVLAGALDPGRLRSLTWTLAPPQPGYQRLRLGLARYREIAARGGWAPLPDGALLAAGDSGARVTALRTRLTVEGDLPADRDTGSAVYDRVLEQAVRRFQARHGLELDGQAGPATRAALNVPVEDRIGQIELNLERWRWLPRDLGEHYIMVNSAAFDLEVVAAGRPVMTMRAIVGRPAWPTPLVSARVTGLLFAPVWNVPRAIAVQEVLPAMRRDPGYLQRERIRVFRDSARTVEIDPVTIDWSQVSESMFAFQLRQDPGRTNPLGGVKLVSPNRFNVCIHDTPLRALLRERVRTFSHGCVRAERALELVAWLLRDTAWSDDSIRTAMAEGRERWVTLTEPVPVHLCYWTAWMREDGTMEFRNDVYGWDARLADALARR